MATPPKVRAKVIDIERAGEKPWEGDKASPVAKFLGFQFSFSKSFDKVVSLTSAPKTTIFDELWKRYGFGDVSATSVAGSAGERFIGAAHLFGLGSEGITATAHSLTPLFQHQGAAGLVLLGEPAKTGANILSYYDLVRHQASLQVEDLARISDVALDKAYGYGLSQPGTFGWEANKGSARKALDLISAGVTDVEQISAAIHKGWAEVAKTYDDPIYQTKPEKRDNRLKLANTEYKDLAESEKEKDRVVARALLQAYQDFQSGAGRHQGDAAFQRNLWLNYRINRGYLRPSDFRHEADVGPPVSASEKLYIEVGPDNRPLRMISDMEHLFMRMNKSADQKRFIVLEVDNKTETITNARLEGITGDIPLDLFATAQSFVGQSMSREPIKFSDPSAQSLLTDGLTESFKGIHPPIEENERQVLARVAVDVIVNILRENPAAYNKEWNYLEGLNDKLVEKLRESFPGRSDTYYRAITAETSRRFSEIWGRAVVDNPHPMNEVKSPDLPMGPSDPIPAGCVGGGGIGTLIGTDRSQSPWRIQEIIEDGDEIIVRNEETGVTKTLYAWGRGSSFNRLRRYQWVKSDLL